MELEQLFGHVGHRLLAARLGLFPRGAAEPIECRTCAARVLLNEIKAFDGNEQLVLALIAKLEKLMRAFGAAANAELFQADELADAVIDVDDEIADVQIAQIREGRLGELPPLLL